MFEKLHNMIDNIRFYCYDVTTLHYIIMSLTIIIFAMIWFVK